MGDNITVAAYLTLVEHVLKGNARKEIFGIACVYATQTACSGRKIGRQVGLEHVRLAAVA